eukprot:ctg_1642.g409
MQRANPPVHERLSKCGQPRRVSRARRRAPPPRPPPTPTPPTASRATSSQASDDACTICVRAHGRRDGVRGSEAGALGIPGGGGCASRRATRGHLLQRRSHGSGAAVCASGVVHQGGAGSEPQVGAQLGTVCGRGVPVSALRQLDGHLRWCGACDPGCCPVWRYIADSGRGWRRDRVGGAGFPRRDGGTRSGPVGWAARRGGRPARRRVQTASGRL